MKITPHTAVLCGLAIGGLAACENPATESALAPVAGPVEAECLEAVATETGAAGVSVASVTETEAGTTVMVNVEGAEAPWTCVVDADGTVVSVFYSAEG